MPVPENLAVWHGDAAGSVLLETTIGDLLDRQAERYPSREALIFHDPERDAPTRWTYTELRQRADRLARGLMALGVAAGERVAVLAPNAPEWILLELALAKIGAVMVTVNTAYRRDELGYLLRQGRVGVLCCVAAYRGNDYLANLRAAIVENPLLDLRHVVLIGDVPSDGVTRFDDLERRADEVPVKALSIPQAAVRPSDIVQIQYTSGTTGAPKGVMLSHRGTVNNANLMGDRAGFTEQDRLLAVMPLFHTAGCVCNVLGMLTKGGTLVGIPAFDAPLALRLLAEERITVMNGVPTMYLRLLAEPGVREGHHRANSTFRTAFTGGTTIPASVMRDLRDAFGAEPMVIMGMTEASPLITQTQPSDSFERNTETAGIPLPFTDIKVIDPIGATVAFGEPGELCIRGYGVTPGYFDMPDRTADAIDAEGWLHSGDLVTLAPTGHLRVVGRIKDMIIRGGENIYPAEIENLLMRHPAIEQVQVVGVPDAEFGEEAYAFIILRPDSSITIAELREDSRARMSRHKVPRHMEIVTGFPQTASGKVQKFELRKRACRTLGAA